MNWVGGARARAKAREEVNRRAREFNPPGMLDIDSGEDDNGGGGGEDDDEQPHQRSRTRKRRREEDERLNSWKKDVDYVALGYTLLSPQVQRRVVPLLEFLEKKIPQGHMLSLQLSHQMDITRTYVQPPVEEESSVFQTPDTGDSGSRPSSQTSSASAVASPIESSQSSIQRHCTNLKIRDNQDSRSNSGSGSSDYTSAAGSTATSGNSPTSS